MPEEPQCLRVPQKACNEIEINLLLLFKTDSHAKLENKITIEEINSSGSKFVKTLKDFPNDDLFVYNICLRQSNCYKLKITDEKNNGICCENGNGWYDAIWGGKKIDHQPFFNGNQQTLEFGSCN